MPLLKKNQEPQRHRDTGQHNSSAYQWLNAVPICISMLLQLNAFCISARVSAVNPLCPQHHRAFSAINSLCSSVTPCLCGSTHHG
jgi:hypothetical protein